MQVPKSIPHLNIDTLYKKSLTTPSAVPWINIAAIPDHFVTYFVVGASISRITRPLIQHAVLQPFYAHALGVFIGMMLIYSLEILLQKKHQLEMTNLNNKTLPFPSLMPARYFLGHFFAYYAPSPVLALVSAAFIIGPLLLRLGKGIAIMTSLEN
jgi:hypothetical protein